jgi:hypothetical protein
MLKSTPGPWVAHDCYLIDAPGKRFIATMDSCRDVERDANARLIAAAPDLYEALELALTALRGAADITGLSQPAYEIAAERALAKARGDA